MWVRAVPGPMQSQVAGIKPLGNQEVQANADRCEAGPEDGVRVV